MGGAIGGSAACSGPSPCRLWTMAQARTTCPDCGSKLEPITLLDADAKTWRGPAHVLLAYVSSHAKRKGPLEPIEPSGSIFGMRCQECGRVLLYGEPGQVRPPRDARGRLPPREIGDRDRE